MSTLMELWHGHRTHQTPVAIGLHMSLGQTHRPGSDSISALYPLAEERIPQTICAAHAEASGRRFYKGKDFTVALIFKCGKNNCVSYLSII